MAQIRPIFTEELLDILDGIEKEEKNYTLYWSNGTLEGASGVTIKDAITRAGYGQGEVPDLDFWELGYSGDYEWDIRGKRWIKTGKG